MPVIILTQTIQLHFQIILYSTIVISLKRSAYSYSYSYKNVHFIIKANKVTTANRIFLFRIIAFYLNFYYLWHSFIRYMYHVTGSIIDNQEYTQIDEQKFMNSRLTCLINIAAHTFIYPFIFEHSITLCVFLKKAHTKLKGKALTKYHANSHLLTFQLIFNAYWMDQRRSHPFHLCKIWVIS